MRSTRRRLIQMAGAAAATGGCGDFDVKSVPRNAERRLMINGALVIPFAAEGPLDEKTKGQIRATGLSAVKVSLGGTTGSYAQVLHQLEQYENGVAENADVYLPVNKVDDIDHAYETRRIGVIKSFEAATMHDGLVDRIAEFARRGVKIMQLGYNNSSPFGAGAMTNTEPFGLTALGREAISAMEASGVLLDLSHAHKQTSMEAIAAATQPVALTHAGCDAIHPHPRNKSDEELKAVADNGGVVGLYELSYLTPSLAQTPLSAYLSHLQHAINICGEDHVGIGSDALLWAFDTSPESKAQWDAVTASRKAKGVAAPGEGPMPFVVGLNGPQRMHVIADELLSLGMRPSAIDKIMGLNFRRVFADAWQA